MLRLEHSGKTGDVHISLRGAESRWNQTLFFALGAAVFAHLLGWFLFHVHPFRPLYSESLFPPVEVNINLENGTRADVKETIPQKFLWLKPRVSKPSLPKIPLATIEKVNKPLSDNNSANPFLSAEREALYPFFEKEKPTLHPRLEVISVGGLAGTPFTLGPIQEVLAQSGDTLTFDVRVQGATGRIFWYELIEQEKRDLLPLAEAALRELLFEKSPHIPVKQGTVIVTLYEELK